VRYRRAMELNDWLLALHLLSAFALIGAIIVFSVAIVAIRRTDLPEQVVAAARLLPLANVVVVVGSLGVIIFGVWLAIALDGIEVWNGWVIAAIILWAVASETGRRSDPEFEPCVERAKELVAAGQTGPDAQLRELARTQRGLLLHFVATVAALLILIDMIWKPGA
jgi:uncharacterized membrane protein